MKKTLTINIAGIVFHIDEDAYDKLKSYLVKIAEHFKKEEGGSEIVDDIESRIAELFSEKTETEKGVITLAMVKDIIEVMGLPEDFEGDEETGSEQKETSQDDPKRTYTYQSSGKKLYRDPDSRVLGGVCSGLAHYFNMDKVVMRVLWVVLFIITASIAFPAYLILWIAVPKANSRAQRLEMQGQPINAENIGKKFREEYKDVKDNFTKYANSDEFKKARSKAGEYGRRAGSTAKDVGRETGFVITKIFGVLFLLIGFISLTGLLLSVFAASNIAGILPGVHHGFFLDQVFSSSLAGTLMIATFIIVGMPILLLIYAGTKMLFNYVSNSKNVVFTALGVWVIAIIIAIGSTVGAIDVFSTEASESNKEVLAFSSDTIYLELDNEKYADYSISQFEMNNFRVVVKEGEELLISRPEFDIVEADDQEVLMRTRKQSKGNNYNSARNNASSIEYQYRVEDNTIYFDPYFLLDEGSKWRKQKVRATLYLPVGMTVYLDYTMLPIIYDIDNTTNTWDGDMPGEFWTMTEKGLELSKLTEKSGR